MSKPFIVRRYSACRPTGPFGVAYRLPVEVTLGGNRHLPGSVVVVQLNGLTDEPNAPKSSPVRVVIESAEEFSFNYATIWEPDNPGVVRGQYVPVWISAFVSIRDEQAKSRVPSTLEYVGRLASGRVESVSSDVDLGDPAVVAVRELRSVVDAVEATAKARGYDPGAGTIAAWVAANVPGRTIATPTGTQFVSLDVPANADAKVVFHESKPEPQSTGQETFKSTIYEAVQTVFSQGVREWEERAFDSDGFYRGVEFVPPIVVDQWQPLDIKPVFKLVEGEPAPELVGVSIDRSPVADPIVSALNEKVRGLEAELAELKAFKAKVDGMSACIPGGVTETQELQMCRFDLKRTAEKLEALQKEVASALDGLPQKTVGQLRTWRDDAVKVSAEMHHVIDKYFVRSNAPLKRFCTIGDRWHVVLDRFFEWVAGRETELTKMPMWRDNIAAVFATLNLKRHPYPQTGSTVLSAENFNILYDAVMEGRKAAVDPAAKCILLNEKLSQLEVAVRVHLDLPKVLDCPVTMVGIKVSSLRQIYLALTEASQRPKGEPGSTQSLIEEVALLRACISEARGALAGAPMADSSPAKEQP